MVLNFVIYGKNLVIVMRKFKEQVPFHEQDNPPSPPERDLEEPFWPDEDKDSEETD